MDNLEFKIVPEEDIEAAITLMLELSNNPKSITMEQRKKNLQAAREKSGYEVFGAYLDNKLIGVRGIKPLNDPLEDGEGYRLNNFVIAKEYRGQGIGSKFTTFIEDYVVSVGGTYTILFISNNNQESLGLYKKRNYIKSAIGTFYKYL